MERVKRGISMPNLFCKYGTEDLTMDTLCYVCKKRYGDHYGVRCPAGDAKPHQLPVPACRPERVIEILEDFAANRDDRDIYKVAEELRYLIGEQLAEERRKEMAGRSD